MPRDSSRSHNRKLYSRFQSSFNVELMNTLIVSSTIAAHVPPPAPPAGWFVHHAHEPTRGCFPR